MNQNEINEDFYENSRAYFSGLFYLSASNAIENYSQSIKATQPQKKHKQIYKKSINNSDPEKCFQPECIKDKDIKNICCGSNNWVAITGDGQIYTCGPVELNYLCLGKSTKGDNYNLLPLKGIIFDKCSCGPFHTIVSTEDGKLYSWGYNVNCSTLGINGSENRKKTQSGNLTKTGQLGRELDKNGAIPGEIPCELDSPILSVNCGANFSMLLTEKGTIYSWGCNDEKQLGRDTDLQKVIPIPSNLFNSKVLKIACGAHHVLAKTENSLYGWGWNEFSQVGFPNSSNVIAKPTIIDKLTGRRVRDIAAGNTHSIATTASGRVVSWGSNDFGELGRVGDPLPHSVKVKSKALSCSCGETTSSVTCEDGSVYVWGRLAGEEFSENQYSPRRLQNQLFVNKTTIGSTHWFFQVDDFSSKVVESFSSCCFTSEEVKNEIVQKLDPFNMKIIQDRIIKSAYEINPKIPFVEVDKGFLNFGWQTSTSSQVLNVNNPTSKNIKILFINPKDLPNTYSIYCPPDIEIKAKTKIAIPFTISRKAQRPPEVREDYIRLIAMVAYYGSKPSYDKKKMKAVKFHIQMSITENPNDIGKRPNKLETSGTISQSTDLSTDLSDDGEDN